MMKSIPESMVPFVVTVMVMAMAGHEAHVVANYLVLVPSSPE